mmetsp:Transcript_27509/g.66846  ORF Transcript_27509/g.66846 Transcript_27509/m.66846 type:complete len:225 (+) Transcript_27509:651-1325(+)
MHILSLIRFLMDLRTLRYSCRQLLSPTTPCDSLRRYWQMLLVEQAVPVSKRMVVNCIESSRSFVVPNGMSFKGTLWGVILRFRFFHCGSTVIVTSRCGFQDSGTALNTSAVIEWEIAGGGCKPQSLLIKAHNPGQKESSLLKASYLCPSCCSMEASNVPGNCPFVRTPLGLKATSIGSFRYSISISGADDELAGCIDFTSTTSPNVSTRLASSATESLTNTWLP